MCNWKYPIVIVIQNIKTFPSDNLNDLIYLVKKYRSKHRLKLCLMLGVQNNSYEDLMSKISIKTSNFMIMKKFYFPSMKRILLEVIYRLLKSKRSIYMFGQNFLKAIIENIQVYGLSLEKFKRIIHYLLASKFNENEYFYVNALLDKKLNNAEQEKLVNEDDEVNFPDLITKFSKNNKLIDDLQNWIDTTKKYLKEDILEYDSDQLKVQLWKFYK